MRVGYPRLGSLSSTDVDALLTTALLLLVLTCSVLLR